MKTLETLIDIKKKIEAMIEKEIFNSNGAYKKGTFWKSKNISLVVLCDGDTYNDTFAGTIVAVALHDISDLGHYTNWWPKNEFTQVYPEWKEAKA